LSKSFKIKKDASVAGAFTELSTRKSAKGAAERSGGKPAWSNCRNVKVSNCRNRDAENRNMKIVGYITIQRRVAELIVEGSNCRSVELSKSQCNTLSYEKSRYHWDSAELDRISETANWRTVEISMQYIIIWKKQIPLRFSEAELTPLDRIVEMSKCRTVELRMTTLIHTTSHVKTALTFW